MASSAHESNSSDGEDFDAVRVNILATIHDDNYCGLADDVVVRCHHKQCCSRFVAFQGTNTGRRFIGCANKEGNHCGFLEWKDNEWPASMKKALIAIWNLYEKEKTARSVDKLQNAREYVKLIGRKRKLQASMQEKLQDEVGKVQDELKTAVQKLSDAERELIQLKSELHQKNLATRTASNMHKVMRIKVEKDREKLKKEKNDLEHKVTQLVTQESITRGKVLKITEICGDE